MSLHAHLPVAQERDVVVHRSLVLEYLEQCGEFWGGNCGRLAEWTAVIRAVFKPDFGPHVDC